MGKFYTPTPVANTKPVGVRARPINRTKKSGVTRIVRDSYGKPSDWWALCAQVRKRDKGCCIFCGAPENPKGGVYHDVHHIKRLADGGTTTMSNLGLACELCHTKRPGHSHMKYKPASSARPKSKSKLKFSPRRN